MVRTLLTRKWLAALAVAALFAVACVYLGRWQYGRHEEKSRRADLVHQHYSAAPVPFAQAVPPGSTSLDPAREWTRVALAGTYLPDKQLLVRNRITDEGVGFEALVPLRTDDGTTVLVDRGWVRAQGANDVSGSVPPAPGGHVTVTGWVRPGQEPAGDAPAGQLASVDLAEAARRQGVPLAPAYVILQAEDDGSGRAPARPAPLAPPDTDLGPHFAYAIQWWVAVPLGFVLVWIYARREWLESTGEAQRRAELKAARPKKVRIWDEEDG